MQPKKNLLFTCRNGKDPLGLPQRLAKKLRYHLSNHLAMGENIPFARYLRDKRGCWRY
jgi:hypothetical protein